MLHIMISNFRVFRCMCITATRTSDLTVGVAKRTSFFVLVCFEVNPMVLPLFGGSFDHWVFTITAAFCIELWLSEREFQIKKDILTSNFRAFRCLCSMGTRTSELTVGVAEGTSCFVLVLLEVNTMELSSFGFHAHKQCAFMCSLPQPAFQK